ncbi:DUF397 domain-containing protein [Actinacidiphila guanduensis]|uniref:DUF397 domain-containing protein n=1 Tax=Actinacidiphila guanduensis TaxID=310781 RepID=UPI000B84A708|nr:DUF397 domain-containing protein [Actinacidiphila guanduensis]
MLPDEAWVKSSYSDGTGNNCVEVASRLSTHGDIVVRDSKDKTGPALHFTQNEWNGLLALVRANGADFGLI